MSKSEDMGLFYRIPADNRDLNYAKYISSGEKNISEIQDYNSHNTDRYNVEVLKKMLVKLPIVQEALSNFV